MVGPNDESDDADGDHGVGHAEISEDGLAGEGRHDLTDHAERRQDEDVDLGMAEEPEQMLEQDGIAALRGVKKGGAEVAVGE